jgi:hypothetical protein
VASGDGDDDNDASVLSPQSRGSEDPAGGRVSLGYVLSGLAPVIGWNPGV